MLLETTSLTQTFQMSFWHLSHVNGVQSCWLPRDSGQVLLLLSSLLAQRFYNGVTAYLIGKIRKPN